MCWGNIQDLASRRRRRHSAMSRYTLETGKRSTSDTSIKCFGSFGEFRAGRISKVLGSKERRRQFPQKSFGTEEAEHIGH
jgi:hypothetical protein